MCAYIARPIINGIPQGSDWLPNGNTLAYWKLSGDILDYSGNNNHLTEWLPWTGTTRSNWASGKFGTSRYFIGSEGTYPFYTTDFLLPSNNFTISIWVKIDADFASAFEFRALYNSGVASANGFTVGINNAKQPRALLNGSAWLNAVTGLTFTPGQWDNFVLVRDAGIFYYYLNGVKAETTNTEAMITPITSYTIIGNLDELNASNYDLRKAAICELLVENGVWTDEYILNYYNSLK